MISDKLTRVVILGMTALTGEFSWPVRDAITPSALEELETKAKKLFPSWIKPYCVEPSVNCAMVSLRGQQ